MRELSLSTMSSWVLNMDSSFPLLSIMKEKMKVLVPYDGSRNSKNAVTVAIDLAKKFNGSITLLYVHWDHGATTEYDGTEVRDQPSIKIFEKVEPELKSSGVAYVLVSENDPNPPDVILNTAKTENIDSIVMGSRGVGGARAWLLGSVSSKVAAEAHCPVIIVK
jgi:nucleotide-binding universal stress UspA family protein